MKKCLVLLMTALLIMSVAGCSLGVSQEEYDELKKDYNSMDLDYTSLQAKNVLLQADYDTLVAETKAYTKLSKEEKDFFIKAIGKNDIIEEMDIEIDDKTNQITELEERISDLEADIITIKGDPKTYPAGYLYAGSDFEVGRYKIYDGKSNFFVHSSSGESRVNIILGGKYGVEEYIYKFSPGDEIEARGSFKMVTVE